jgi:hypothetical protein
MPLVTLIILGFCWVIPDHMPPWWMIHTEYLAFAASAIGLIGCVRWSRQSTRIPNAVLWIGALLVTVVLQRLLGQIAFAGDAWVAAIYIVLVASAWFWGYQWTKQSGISSVLTAIAYFFLAIGLITSLQIFIQWLKIEANFNGLILAAIERSAPRANIGQPNQAATTVMLAVISTALLYARSNISLIVAGALEILFLLAASLTHSRTALISGVVLAGVLVLYYARLRISTRIVLVLFLSLMLSMLGAYYWNHYLDSMQGRGFITVDPRLLIWQQLVAAIAERPWMGWGWLQIPSAQQFGAIQYPGTVPVNYSHNILLDAFVMLGIPIAGVWSLGGWVWIKGRWKLLHGSPEAILAGILTIPFWIHALLELPHAYAYFLFPIAAIFGAIDASTEGKSAVLVLRSSRYFSYFSILWVVLLLVMGREYLQIEEDFRIDRFENRGIGPNNLLQQKKDIFLFTQLDGLRVAAKIKISPQMNLEEIEMLEKVAKRYTLSSLQLRAAMALALNGRPDEASERMAVIQNLFAADIYTDAMREFLASQR